MINEQILYGSLLGDGCIANNGSYSYMEAHSLNQADYTKWKIKHLAKSYNVRIGKIAKGQIRFQINQKHKFTQLRHLFYPQGKKVVTKEILNKLNALGLLVWYLDDGSYNYGERICRFATLGFTEKENHLIERWFKDKWGLICKVGKTTKTYGKEIRRYYYLHFNADSTRKLLGIIKYAFEKNKLPKDVSYKLGIDNHRNKEAREKKRAYQREYAKESPIYKARAKRFYEKHKTELLRKDKERYKRNRKAILKQKKEYQNRPEVKERIRRYDKLYWAKVAKPKRDKLFSEHKEQMRAKWREYYHTHYGKHKPKKVK